MRKKGPKMTDKSGDSPKSTSSKKSTKSTSSTSSSPSIEGKFVDGYRFKLGNVLCFPDTEIYSVAFHLHDGYHFGRNYFAVCGSKMSAVFECLEDGKFKRIVEFDCEDDKFYTCAWTFLANDHPCVIFGGQNGVIRLIDMIKFEENVFTDHGAAINELKVFITQPDLLLSASRDYTIRLWNVYTQCLVGIFCQAHKDQVLSISIHDTQPVFASCGIDHRICIWSLDRPKIKDAIERSRSYGGIKEDKSFAAVIDEMPAFSTRNVHVNYIDCIYWYGDFLITKSVTNEIVLWRTMKPLEEIVAQTASHQVLRDQRDHRTINIMHRFKLENCENWFCRFSLDPLNRFLVMGTADSTIYAWSLTNTKFERRTIPTFKGVGLKLGLMRQMAFNYDSSILIAVNSTGTILRYDIISNDESD